VAFCFFAFLCQLRQLLPPVCVETTEAIQAKALEALKQNGPVVLEIPITNTIPLLI
jgi:hypothetical protein